MISSADLFCMHVCRDSIYGEGAFTGVPRRPQAELASTSRRDSPVGDEAGAAEVLRERAAADLAVADACIDAGRCHVMAAQDRTKRNESPVGRPSGLTAATETPAAGPSGGTF